MQYVTRTTQQVATYVVVFSSALLVILTAVFSLQGTVGAQQLEKATECGSNMNFIVSEDCTIEKQIAECKRSVSGSEEQKNKACNPQTGIEKLIQTIINVISAIVGAVAVIMIIIGGFKYVTSGGDSNSVSGAKNTILYAIVGLVIVAFAQIIVRFVLQRI